MKKLLAILLAITCIVSVAACGNTNPPAADPTPTPDDVVVIDDPTEPEGVEDPETPAAPQGEFADLAILDIPLTDEEYAIGFRLNSDLVPVVDAAIALLMNDGTLAALAEKYGVADLLITGGALVDAVPFSLDTAASTVADLAAITAAGKLVIGITEYEPMNYYDATGTLVGFDTEFAQAVCAILGVEAEFVVINWDTKEIELAGKQIDCIWNGLTVTEPRRLNMDFSVSYLRNEQALVVKKNIAANYTDLASLAGLTIVAEEGSAGETAALEIDGINYVPVAAQSSAMLEVKAGTADAAIVDITMARELTK